MKSSYLTNSRALAQGFATGALAKDQTAIQAVMALEAGLEAERGNNNVALLVLVSAYKKALLLERREELQVLGPAIAEVIWEQSQRLDRILTLRFGLTRFASKGEVTARVSKALGVAGSRAEVQVYTGGSVVKRTKPTPKVSLAAGDDPSSVGKPAAGKDTDLQHWWKRKTSLRQVSEATREKLYLQAKEALERRINVLRRKGLNLDIEGLFSQSIFESADPENSLSVLFHFRRSLKLAYQNGLVVYIHPLQEEPNLHLIFDDGERYTATPRGPYFYSQDRKRILAFAHPNEPTRIAMTSERYGRSDSYTLFLKGEPFTWNGKDFKNEWGDALKIDAVQPVEGGYRITLHPKVAPAHPQGLAGENHIFYRGKRFAIKPFDGKPNHYSLTPDGSLNPYPTFLVLFDEQTKRVRLAEGVFLYQRRLNRFGDDKIFVDGYRYYAWTKERMDDRFLYRTSSSGPPLFLLGDADGRFSKFQTDETGGVIWRKKLIFGSAVYEVSLRENDFVYAYKNPLGFFDNWFVGRRLPSTEGLPRVVPLQEEELEQEFERLLARVSEEWGAGDLSFSRLPRPKTIDIKLTKRGVWTTKADVKSGNPIAFIKYKVTLDGEHTIQLFLPAGETVWSPSVWEESLKQFPKKTLLGIKEIVIIPKGEELRGNLENVGGTFNAKKRRVVVREREEGKELVATLFHEILGHGTEIPHPLFEELVVLAMKLDGRIIDDYSIRTVGEHYARGAEILALHPHLHRDYPHLMKLLRRMADVDRRHAF